MFFSSTLRLFQIHSHLHSSFFHIMSWNLLSHMPSFTINSLPLPILLPPCVFYVQLMKSYLVKREGGGYGWGVLRACVKIVFYLYSICILYCTWAHFAPVAIKNSRVILHCYIQYITDMRLLQNKNTKIVIKNQQVLC